LRAKLHEYYEGPGKLDAIVIDVPQGSYAPGFQSRATPVPVRGTVLVRLLVAIAALVAAVRSRLGDFPFHCAAHDCGDADSKPGAGPPRGPAGGHRYVSSHAGSARFGIVECGRSGACRWI